jgi:hypothetical protein
VRYVLAIAPREAHEESRPPRLEPEWGTPWFCGTCGRRFPLPLITVQAGDEDSSLVEQLLSKPPPAAEHEER